ILFESAPDGYYLTDLKGTFIDGNKAAEEMLGYQREELIGRSFLKLNLLSVRELPRAAKGLASNMLGLGTGPEEYNLVRKDGSAVPVEIRTHPVKIKGKTVVLGIARDITERKRAQEEIHKLSQFRGSVIDNANVWLDVLDAETNVVVWNRAAEEISGYTREEVVGHNKIWEWLYPDEAYRNEILAAAAIIERGGAVEGFETTIQRKDGETRIISWNSRDLMDEEGTRTGAIALGRDVTEWKRAEAALREERDFAESLVDTAQTIVLLLDTEGRIVHFNPYMEALSGYSLDEVQGEDWFSTLVPAEDQAKIRELFQRAVGDIPTLGNVNPILTKDGRARDIEWHDTTLKDADGNVVGLLATGQDITDRVQAEEERELLLAQVLAQSRQMQSIIDTVPEGVLVLDARGHVILANPVAEGHLAVLADVKVGDPVTRLGERPLAELLTSPPTKGLWHEVTADNRTFEIMARPMANGPEPEHWVMVINDVTQAREIERRTQQQARLAAVGQLAAGIAHDFNNILAVIVLYTQMGLRLPDIPAQHRDRLRTVDQQAKRATGLVQQILDFSRRAVLKRRPMDLTPFLKETVILLERTVPESIKLEFTYGRDEYTVNADPTRIQQAVMNLVVNARDAMLPKGGGKLDIELDRVQVARHQEPPLPEMEAGEWVRVRVTDTGEGIPADVLPHIFEPFFTTKDVGKGTGLGLAQVYGIVKQHEGHIDIGTKTGAGTAFTIYLPALLEHRPEAPA
ncbi:MAG: PAS domain S-box protein, partial [Anaerolineae bacterium]|nr:PAS domain S-box protein [Anaerolineae bacterium]